MFSPKWSTLLVLFAMIYASRDRFQIPSYTGSMAQVAEETVSTDLEKRQLVTGFIQAERVLIRPVTDPVATHVVSFSGDDLAPLASFSTPALSGIVHFTGRTLKFFQVIIDRSLHQQWTTYGTLCYICSFARSYGHVKGIELATHHRSRSSVQ
jgi:hypothetical protein